MTAFGVFFLTLGLASGVSIIGYSILRVLMGSYLDANLGVMWEVFSRTPYQPPRAREILVGLGISLAMCLVGALLTRPERKTVFRRITVSGGAPKPPSS